MLNQLGFKYAFSFTNDIELCIKQLSIRLSIDGGPGLMISGWVALQIAAYGRYRYTKLKTGGQPVPDKNESSQVADALEYPVFGA